jgi:hypothetical protein
MSSIFSHALSQVKSNPHAADKTESYGNSGRDGGESRSILDRIKLNKKPGKTIKTINIHKTSDDEDSSSKFSIDTIQKKVIKKDITSLKRPTKKNDSNDMWKHDLYDGPTRTAATTVTMDCKVFVRNLPDMISSQHLKDLLQNDDEVVGIRMDNGTAEINFQRRDAAQKAADHLNGKMFRGNKLKAAVMGDLNASMYNKPTTKRPERTEERKQDIEDRVSFKSKMQSEAESDRKPSILSRIKKSR